MIEVLKKLVGIKTSGTAEAEPVPEALGVLGVTEEPAENYGDLSKLLAYVGEDVSTELQRQECRNEFTDQRFLMEVKVRNISNCTSVLMVFCDGNFILTFEKKWSAELIKINRGQRIRVDAAFEKVGYGELHFHKCRLVDNDSDKDKDGIDVKGEQS